MKAIIEKELQNQMKKPFPLGTGTCKLSDYFEYTLVNAANLEYECVYIKNPKPFLKQILIDKFFTLLGELKIDLLKIDYSIPNAWGKQTGYFLPINWDTNVRYPKGNTVLDVWFFGQMYIDFYLQKYDRQPFIYQEKDHYNYALPHEWIYSFMFY